ncbi:MAG: DUF2807 domain-containing protein [Pyrinomonadaceae bacterium]|nr:DUF2807 domain-containing protein [Pyrinomonadaceae bacterium]
MRNLNNLLILSFVITVAAIGISTSTACADAAADQKEVRNGENKQREDKKTGPDMPFEDDLKLEVRNVTGFTGVHIGGAMTAKITSGQAYKVTIEAEEKMLPKIITEVKDGNLVVRYEKGYWKNKPHRHKKVRVTVSLPKINEVDISGASTATVAGVDTPDMKIDVSGASTLRIKGNARNIEVDLSGASSMKAIDLKSESARMDVSGASSAKVSVSTKLGVDAAGASSVCYSGRPTVTKDTSGASSVRGGC